MTGRHPAVSGQPDPARRGELSGWRRWYDIWSPILVGMAGIVVSLLLWRALKADERREVEQRVAAEATIISRELAGRMEGRILALVRMAARWAPEAARSSEQPIDPEARSEWEREAGTYLSHFPGYHAILWIAPEQTVRWAVPSSFDRGVPSDQAADPRQRALHAAREERAVRLTASVRLANGEPGFLFYAPMYEGDRFGGWIGAASSYRGLFDVLLAEIATGYGIEIDHDEDPVYRFGDDSVSGSKPKLRSRITLYGSPLTIGVSPTPSLLADLSSPLPETVLVSGLLVSCLLALALHFAHGARRRARALLAEREDLRQTEKALRESEEVFRTMFEASSVGIARTGPEGRFLLTNAAYRRMLGYSAAEMDRLTVEEVTHPEDWPRNRELFQRLISREIPSFQIEKRYRRKDGSEIWVHNSVSAVFDAADRPLFVQAVSQDVSEVKRAGEALRAGEAKYRLLAEHASDLITRFTPEGEITYASPAAERMLGFRPEELIDRHAREFIHPEDLERVAESRRSLLRGEKVTDTVEFRLRRKNGEYLWAESASQAIWDPHSSRADSVISATRDITESVRATQRNRLLQGITAAANQSPAAERAMQTALELICEHTGWPVGHASMMARDAHGEMASTDVWKVQEPAHLDRWRRIMEGMRSAGAGLLERVLTSGQAAWIEDTTKEAGFQAAADGGIRAVFAFPVRSGDTTLAVLEFFSPDSVSHDERLMEVMNDIGLQLGQMVQRQRSEKALAASEMRFRTLAGTAHDAIVIADERGRIVYCNEGIEQIFGYECDELVGQPLTVLMPERFHAPYTEGLARFLETREPSIMGRPIEMSGRRKDGSEVPVEMVLSWWESEEGVSFTGILRDVTRRKRAETMLTEKLAELARSNSELELFTYIASHDLREPLRTVASNVQLLDRRLGNSFDTATRKEIGFAIGGIRRMQALIDDLLTYSRVGTDGKPFGPVDCAAVLSEAIQALKVAVDESEAEITRDPLPTVIGNQSQLIQLLQNLLSNALKFHGPDSPRVHVSARHADGEWIFSVRDNGIGIPPEYSEHIFTVFQRLHSAAEYPGTGIGLAVCRKIAERHRGRIWVESEPGQGSTFRFTIPDAQAGLGPAAA